MADRDWIISLSDNLKDVSRDTEAAFEAKSLRAAVVSATANSIHPKEESK